MVNYKDGVYMKIGVIQLQSVLDPKVNLEKIRGFMSEAKGKGVQAIFLPEVFYSISNGLVPTPYLIEGKNEHYEAIRSLAVDFGMYLIGGSAATKVGDKIMNRAFNFSPEGEELTYYDKINLFAVDLSKHPSNTVVDEKRVYSNGHKPEMIEIGDYKIGLAICFDLRFPELFRSYSFQGANVLSIPAAFTVPTGKAHWHTLQRARAIENQCYVVASAQWGIHNERISTFGHSLVVDPWGEVIADAGEGEKIIYAYLDLQKLETIRSRLNVLRDPKA